VYIGCKTPPNRQTRHSIISVHFFFPYCSRVLCVSVFWGVCVSEWEKEKKKKKKRVSWAVWFGFNTFISKMPRPGPRPYECVRRAWHSERHQPVRGSIIQQIFRFWVLLVFPLSFFYLSPLFRSCAFPWRYCTPCVWLGSSMTLTVPRPRRTRNGKRSSPWWFSRPKKSCTPKPIPRFFLLSQNACGIWILRSFHCVGWNPFCLIFLWFGCLGRVLESWYALGPPQWCR